MSTTDQRTGFRLPWSADGRTRDTETDTDASNGTDHPESDAPEASAVTSDSGSANDAASDPDAASADHVASAEDVASDSDGTSDSDGASDSDASTADADMQDANMTWPEVDRRIRQIGRRSEDRADAALADITAGATGVTTRRTNALMAGLSKAMHEAAETARVETLERLAADAAARTETIKASAADESAAIKQAAESDISSVRDWSKAELARVREETDTRIAARREALERETELHAAKVEARVERVKRIVAAFESSMAEFFSMLLAETDPARVALLAEQLPEPPSLEVDDELEAAFEAFEAEADAADAAADDEPTVAIGALDATATTDAEDAPETTAAGESDPEDELIGDVPADIADTAGTADTEATAELDAAAAAEAEAEAFAAAEDAPDAVSSEPDTDKNALSEEALVARLAKMEIAEAGNARAAKTELVVSGLVSVAGIAGFKRAINRIPGVTGVGVTSGPGGEFVYSVSHGPEADFRSAFEAMPGFSARITAESEGSLQITASDHNPDS